jgi:exonuclease VII small subunit
VELPADFDLKSLPDKTAVEQAQAVFDARRAQVERLIKQLQREKEMLDQAVRKPTPGK